MNTRAEPGRREPEEGARAAVVRVAEPSLTEGNLTLAHTGHMRALRYAISFFLSELFLKHGFQTRRYPCRCIPHELAIKKHDVSVTASALLGLKGQEGPPAATGLEETHQHCSDRV